MMQPEELIETLADLFSDRQLFLVGGCLRDHLLGRPVSDLDLATDAWPDEVRRRVEEWADAVWMVGERFGTVGLQKGGAKAEITTFRSDTYDGVSRKPEVAFGTDIVGDLSRRDFTINAMARSAHTGELLDPFQGRRDLEDHVVRFVGDPAQRIREDPLRMLRAVRFCAQLGLPGQGFSLAPEAVVAIWQGAEELRRISWERIRDEMDGILVSPHPGVGLVQMIGLGLARHVLPELLGLHLPWAALQEGQMKGVLRHTLETVQFAPPEKTLRWAALLHDIAKPETFSRDETGVHFYRHEQMGVERAREILTRLRHSSAFIEQVLRLVRHHLRIPSYRSEWSDAAVRRLMYELGDQFEAAMALAEADVRASDPFDYPEFQHRLQELRGRVRAIGEAAELARMKPLLNGEEVMKLLGTGPGPRVGEVLRFLLDEQIEGRLTTREQAEAAVRERFGGDR